MKRFSYLPTLNCFAMLAETQVFFRPNDCSVQIENYIVIVHASILEVQ